MRKIILIFLFLLTGCSSTTLTCSKNNFSTIYGSEVQNEIYTFKNNKLFNYMNVKKIIFDNNMIKYIDDIYNFNEKELNIIKENIKGTDIYIKKSDNSISLKIDIDISLTDSSLEKLNIDKNLSINYLRKNLIEKGFSCELQE